MISIDSISIFNTILFYGIISVILCLFIIKSLKRQNYYFKTKLVSLVEKDLNNYLISTTENEGTRLDSVKKYQLEDIEKEIRSKRRKDIFIKYLISLKKDLFGEYNEVLSDLYEKLNLFQSGLRKIKSWDYTKKVVGIREISEFHYVPGYNLVLKYISSSNPVLRQETQIALMKMNTKDPLFFLEKEWRDLSDWHKLRIHDTLRSTTFKHTIWFDQYLIHPSDEVKAFIVQLCLLFKRVETMEGIRLLITEGDDRVKFWVLRAITEMGDDRDIDRVVDLLVKSVNPEIQLECINALGQIGGETEVKLLINYLDSESEKIQYSSIRAIDSITGDVSQIINQHQGPKNSRWDTMIAHLKDNLN